MTAASLSDYRLRTRDGRDEYGLAASSLELRGNVTCTRPGSAGASRGCCASRSAPRACPLPPVIPPFVFMTRVSAEQALVTSDVIVTDGLRLEAS
ncbi:hypothetical protein GCM10010347_56710 [Streptomyces cirratus]|uniref:Uncharacterized protein n=2 Tax=Streptomyces cirratus TaxID=68187 RepID=A0ABQ3F0A9_9ACTN|nr:hypothetical protein GCM10010347_56710 [Streptomyces cirratus]